MGKKVSRGCLSGHDRNVTTSQPVKVGYNSSRVGKILYDVRSVAGNRFPG